ncbi:MAG: class II aldolase/adducin family protein [Ktedonobacteraceae bacterium]|nr:class II aldolase/adducin family protein [Ktedonobacteraceae bacterium]
MALSCRILAMEGLVEGILGHVSARIPDSDEMFIRCRSEKERGVLFTKMSAIRRVDFDGRGEDLGSQYEVPKELPIHGEIYKARPQVGCVIHAHPPTALLCGITDLEFRPVFGAFNIPALRMALDGIPVFPRSVLVSRPELAHSLLEVMGQKQVCLMKGHGITVTGATIEETTMRALNFNTLAQVTLQIAQTGKKVSDISQEDIVELPDLGSTFNDLWSWRYYAQRSKDRRRA